MVGRHPRPRAPLLGILLLLLLLLLLRPGTSGALARRGVSPPGPAPVSLAMADAPGPASPTADPPACHPTCAQCFGPTGQDCLRCPDGRALHQGACLPACPAGFFPTPSTEGTLCRSCHTSCAGCIASDAGACTACQPGLVLLEGRCQPGACPAGTFPDPTSDSAPCRACHRSCSTCTGPDAGHCLSCPGHAVLTGDGACRPACPAGHYLSPDRVPSCRACHATCAACRHGQAADCTACPAGRQLSLGRCVSPCGPGATLHQEACVACHASCTECSGPGQGHCLACSAGLWLGPDGRCLGQCPAGWFPEPAPGRRCLACPAPCDQCVSSTECTVCRAGWQLDPGSSTCRPAAGACPQGRYPAAGKCLPCHHSCRACSGPSEAECLLCPAHRVHWPGAGTCPLVCPAAEYLESGDPPDPTGRRCAPCARGCRACAGPSPSACSQCQAPFLQVGDQCLASCPAGFIQVPDLTQPDVASCRACPAPCTACVAVLQQAGDPACLACSPGYALVPAAPGGPGSCVSCPARCLECSDPARCHRCEAGFQPDPSSGACLPSCPPGTWFHPTARACQPCAGPCARCLDAPDHCTACTPGTYLSQGTCAGCHASCSECQGEAACTACAPGLVFPGPPGQSLCTDACPAGQFADLPAGRCSPCVGPCAECLGAADRCTACLPGAFPAGGTCAACHGSCATCPGPEACATCAEGHLFAGAPGQSLCLAACPAGTFPDSAAGRCTPCHATCAACTGAARQCTACAPGFRPEGPWSEAGRCVACPDGCAGCDAAGRCTACAPGLQLTPAGQCASDCPAGHYPQADACLPCHESCASCSGARACGTCQPGLVFASPDGLPSLCVFSCPEGHFADPQSGRCAACHASCAACTTAAGQCTACAPAFRPEGAWSTAGRCVACPAGCAACDPAGRCTACTGALLLTPGGACESSCPAGQFAASGRCHPCRAPCVQCIDTADHCITCIRGTFLREAVCTACDASCAACSTAQACSTCAEGHLFAGAPGQSLCLAACPAGTFPDPAAGRCAPCHASCAACTTAADQCTACAPAFRPEGAWSEAGRCVACPTACSACDPAGRCTACTGALLLAPDGTCASACPAHTWPDTGARVCRPCQAPCSRCTGPRACVSCLPGTYLDRDACLPCDASCAACPGPAACDTCARGLLFAGEPGHSLCLAACPAGTFPAVDRCAACHATCAACTGAARQCTACAPRHRPEGDWPAGGAGGRCVPCPAACTACDPAGRCTACAPGLQLTPAGQCASGCPAGHYPQADACLPCQAPCAECTGPGHCLSCPPGAFLQLDTCAECDASCAACSDGRSCDVCRPGHFFARPAGLPGLCLDACPAGSLPLAGHCTPCHASCAACATAADRCTRCAPAFRPEGAWSEAGRCVACPAGCAACDPAGRCTACTGALLLAPDGTCASACPAATFPHDRAVCLPCDPSCSRCTDDQACLECAPGLVFLSPDPGARSLCVGTCPAGFLPEGPRCLACVAPCARCTEAPDRCTACLPGLRLAEPAELAAQPAAQCVPCPAECAGCLPDGRCTACPDAPGPGARPVLSPFGRCLAHCPAGWYADPEAGRCRPCNGSCATCSGPSACDTCQPGLVFLAPGARPAEAPDPAPPGPGGTLCTDVCPAGQVPGRTPDPAASPQCVPCAGACATCVHTPDQCVACAPGHRPHTPHDLPGACVPCPTGCHDCLDNGRCLACLPGSGLVLTPAGRCAAACPDGWFASGHGHCLRCADECATCTGPLPAHCTACRPGASLLPAPGPGHCATPCPAGHFRDDTSPECRACHRDCASCTGPTSGHCVECSAPGLLQLDGHCVDACPDSFFPQAGRRCVRCHGACHACAGPGPGDCLSCPAGLVALSLVAAGRPRACGSFCPAGSALDPEAVACRACPADCPQCDAAGVCQACGPGWLLAAGAPASAGISAPLAGPGPGPGPPQPACIRGPDCPAGAAPHGTRCLACAAGCATCAGPEADQCLTCAPGFDTPFEGACLAACPQAGYFPHPRTGQCVGCHASCLACTSIQEDACTACPPDHALWQGTCLAACPAGTFRQAPDSPDASGSSGHQDAPGSSGHQDAPGSSGHQDAPGSSGHQDASGSSDHQGAPAPPGMQDAPVPSGYRCIPCDSECAGCEGPGPGHCTGCPAGRLLGPDGHCLDECPTGFGPCHSDGRCIRCPAGCARCQPAPDQCQSGVCLACQPGLFLGLDSQCHDACPVGEFPPASVPGQCFQCAKACASCASSAEACTSCADADHWLVLGTGECTRAACPEMGFATFHDPAIGRVCIPCHVAGCEFCSLPPAADPGCRRLADRGITCPDLDRCDRCASGRSILPGGQAADQCVLACPGGFFSSSTPGSGALRCMNCAPGCNHCQGPLPVDCLDERPEPSSRPLALGLGIGIGSALLILLIIGVIVLVIVRRHRAPHLLLPKTTAPDYDATVLNTLPELSMPGAALVSADYDFIPIEEGKLGEGAQASVYSARVVGDGLISRLRCPAIVAIKRSKESIQDDLRDFLFQNEISLMWLARGQPNIVQIFGYSERPQALIMEKFDSCLQTLLFSGVALAMDESLDLMADSLRAFETQQPILPALYLQSDVYSTAVLLWVILARRAPSHEKHRKKISRDTQAGCRPAPGPVFDRWTAPDDRAAADRVLGLVERAWAADPTHRPTAGALHRVLVDIRAGMAGPAPAQAESGPPPGPG
ncbi:hypothetical protein H696_04692 [Fonticula alba]|uniref:Serine/threonine protein kinase n=1 Tax=Fonticula alba TaxID=691883 RepID=A0A058Z2A1_FONAL|nr:hypothetical protein H696_04692 [Fonticula alba]KCV68399.1 hypothetical protein H696_04692 [Fonticula alba]|eukprot:XP_009496831.1 hypothetical protein H696_04692 [Fonticula alba]